MNQFAKMAVFDPATKNRRLLLGKIHIAKKQLGMVDDDYVALLLRVAGVTSASNIESDADLVKVVDEMTRLGFQAKPKAGAPRPADNPIARKARAMWISLYQLGVVRNSAENALEAFACRQLGVARMQWMNRAHGDKLIEALKAMADAAGWEQSLKGVAANDKVLVLKQRLARRLLEMLGERGLMPSDWTEKRAIATFTGEDLLDIRAATLPDLDRICTSLALTLRQPMRTISAGEIVR